MPEELKITSEKLPCLYSVKTGWRISISVPSKKDITDAKKIGCLKFISFLNDLIKANVKKEYKRKCASLS